MTDEVEHVTCLDPTPIPVKPLPLAVGGGFSGKPQKNPCHSIKRTGPPSSRGVLTTLNILIICCFKPLPFC